MILTVGVYPNDIAVSNEFNEDNSLTMCEELRK